MILTSYTIFAKNVAFNKLRDMSSGMSQPEEQRKQAKEAEVLEQGDIYFFYRPKKAAEEVKGIEDVRRFFMVTAPEEQNSSNSNNKS